MSVNKFIFITKLAICRSAITLQTHHVHSTLKRCGNGRFHVVSTWNTHGVFVGNAHIKHKTSLIKNKKVLAKNTSLHFELTKVE